MESVSNVRRFSPKHDHDDMMPRNLARVKVYGLEFVFFKYETRVLLDGQLHCKLANHLYSLSQEAGPQFVDRHLYFVTYFNFSHRIVQYDLQSIFAGDCSAVGFVAPFENLYNFFFTVLSPEPLVVLINQTLLLGEKAASLELFNVREWSFITAATSVNGLLLVAGHRKTPKTNYFVLLDTNLQVLDRAQIAKPAKDGSIG